jgi:hypothetical protein
MRTAILFAAALGVVTIAQPAIAQQGGDTPPAATAAPEPGIDAPPEKMAGRGDVLDGLPVYSSDNQKVGGVKSVEKNSDESVGTLQAEIEGFLGLGTSSVRFTPDQFKQAGDRVVLSQTAAKVRGEPDASYKSFDRGGASE